MNDLSVTLAVQEWTDILVDLDAFEGAIGNRDLEGYGEELEPGSKALREALRSRGLEI